MKENSLRTEEAYSLVILIATGMTNRKPASYHTLT